MRGGNGSSGLYLTDNLNDKTLIGIGQTNSFVPWALFALDSYWRDGNPEYRGSGEVPGYIGTSNPSFLMSENDTDLRVFSSSWAGRGFPLAVMESDTAAIDQTIDQTIDEEDFGIHKLTILRESADGTRLDQLAQLPNRQRPDAIGKPGEDLYADRFVAKRAYAFTFEVIDPLYVLELSDPEDPRISGELELLGFSTLLQPLGKDLLLGVGSDVPADGLGLTQGVKVALFNVANISAPVELESIVIGKRGSSSPALYNHHALTLLETEGTYRAAKAARIISMRFLAAVGGRQPTSRAG